MMCRISVTLQFARLCGIIASPLENTMTLSDNRSIYRYSSQYLKQLGPRRATATTDFRTVTNIPQELIRNSASAATGEKAEHRKMGKRGVKVRCGRRGLKVPLPTAGKEFFASPITRGNKIFQRVSKYLVQVTRRVSQVYLN